MLVSNISINDVQKINQTYQEVGFELASLKGSSYHLTDSLRHQIMLWSGKASKWKRMLSNANNFFVQQNDCKIQTSDRDILVQDKLR